MLLRTMVHVHSATIKLFIIVSLFSIGRIHATYVGNETDRLALLAFKHSLHDPKNSLSSWNDSFHFCQWEGVTCGPRHQRAKRIVLHAKGLAGPLSPYVGNLSFLRLLNIFNNTFYGEIPPQVGRLFRLQGLYVGLNNFEGEIPANISHCLKLTGIGVESNNLGGKLPKELGLLSKLTSVSAQLNSFTGGIGHFLGNLTSLERFSARKNLFEGSIPRSIGQLKSLKQLGLGQNKFHGTIPPSLYNLSLLTIISLDQNQLQGSLPPNIGSMLPHLQTVKLSYNQFSGSLPLSFSNCSDLLVLQLSRNNFEGKIAVDFGGLKYISLILLSSNNFGSGEIDEMNFIGTAANCSNLDVLEISNNKLRGSLPNSVGNLSNQLFFLNLGENQIYGRLPSTIGHLVNLSTLDVSDNQFIGKIPSSIGNLGKLQRMNFGINKFSGTIPDSIGNLSLLIELYMEMNGFEGIIPISLGNCTSLLSLDLSQNKLNGPIPKQLFRLSALSMRLNLSGNHLHGSLPTDVGNLKSLGILDLSNNHFSGEIPSSLAGCISLENLFLQKNIFQGSIPLSFSSLKGVINLDLSHNNLSGKIPRFFEQFSMKYLNLSFNNFEGEVPIRGVFANQSAISLIGNNKLCGGMSKLHLPKCLTEGSKNRQGRFHALIIVISITCTVLCVTIISCFLICNLKVTRKVKSSIPFLKEPLLRVSYEMLLKATDGFSLENLVGRGSFGSVYKGILDKVVAVKVLNLQSRGAFKSFMIECEALRNARHRNLVKIITSCSSVDFQGNDFKALVYEFMPNGSLESWLYSSQEAYERGELQRLSLLRRINIAIDVACALEYLHHQCENCIIHCDLKPSNILLDEDMVAHVGDFGLAKFLLPELTSSDAIQSNSIELRGTIGYVAPEYATGNEASTMGDVYSYGILILEMMTGKRPTDPMFEGGLNLHNFAKMSLHDHVMDILDPILVNNIGEEEVASSTNNNPEIHGNTIVECLISTIKIGVCCSMELAQDRMDIRNVLVELHSIGRILPNGA